MPRYCPGSNCPYYCFLSISLEECVFVLVQLNIIMHMSTFHIHETPPGQTQRRILFVTIDMEWILHRRIRTDFAFHRSQDALERHAWLRMTMLELLSRMWMCSCRYPRVDSRPRQMRPDVDRSSPPRPLAFSNSSFSQFAGFSIFANSHVVHDLCCKTGKPAEQRTDIHGAYACVFQWGQSCVPNSREPATPWSLTTKSG